LKPHIFVWLFLILPALFLPGQAGGSPEEDPLFVPEKKPLKGIRIDRVDRGSTETIAWIRIRVLLDTPFPETWSVLENIDEWDRFMDLYSKVVRLPSDEMMDRYELTVSPPWPINGASNIVRVMQKPKEHAFDYWVEGGFMQGTFGKISAGKEYGGSWILFENCGSPGHRSPDWLVKMAVYLVVPSVLKDIRQHILEIMEEAEKRPAAPGAGGPGTETSGQVREGPPSSGENAEGP
jgi:hypothetical protein